MEDAWADAIDFKQRHRQRARRERVRQHMRGDLHRLVLRHSRGADEVGRDFRKDVRHGQGGGGGSVGRLKG